MKLHYIETILLRGCTIQHCDISLAKSSRISSLMDFCCEIS
jgi:hypothetical protein